MAHRSKTSGVLFLFVSALLWGVGPVGAQADLSAAQYYIAPIGRVDVPLASLIQSVQSSGFTTIIRSGDEVTAYLGTARTDQPEELLLGASSLLYVDDGFFLLKVAGEDLDYVVRPAEGGYALVLIPHRDLGSGEALLGVLSSLQTLGILGQDVAMELTGLPKEPAKLPAPPQGVALDSSLYGLALAADWFSYAAAHGLTRVGLRAEAVAEKVPGGGIPEAFRPYVVSETEGLAKLLVPIHQLVDLARSPSIGYVRPPYRPQPMAP